MYVCLAATVAEPALCAAIAAVVRTNEGHVNKPRTNGDC